MAVDTTPGPTGFARIPIADVTLAEAVELVEDSQFYFDTRIPILFHFPQVSVDGYWELKVRDHTEMVFFLRNRELLDG